MKRTIYLKKKTLAEARTIVFTELVKLIHLGPETISVIHALNRVTAEPLFAKISSPPFHCAAMDGIAVKADGSYGATEESPKSLLINKEALFINTGNPIPPEMDAVIMIEDVHLIDSERLEIREAAYPWQHIRAIGEDVIATEMVFPENHKIIPYDIGALLATGHQKIKVKKKPSILIIPTGSELVELEQTDLNQLNFQSGLIPTGIIESNSHVLSGLIIEDGGNPVRLPIVEDNPQKIKEGLLANYER